MATCASYLAWWGTLRESGAIVAGSTIRFSFTLRFFVRYNKDVV
jgi:hypothetical protein